MSRMDITIDTTHPLNDTDRAVLRALLEGTPPTTPIGHQGTPRGRSATDIAAAVTGAATRPAGGPSTSIRGPVASQPGVRLTESTSENENPAG